MANFINQITFVTIDGGKSFITYYMLLSLFRLIPNAKVIVLLNKNNRYIYLLEELEEKYNIRLIKNFNNSLLTYKRHRGDCSIEHCVCIDYIFNNVLDTKYMLLLDNDIIFKENFLNFFVKDNLEKIQNSVVTGFIENNTPESALNILLNSYKCFIDSNANLESVIKKYNVNPDNFYIKNNTFYITEKLKYQIRFAPYFILFNKELFKKYNLKFFNDYKTDLFFSNNDFKQFFKGELYKDTLSYLTTEIVNNHMRYNNLYIYDYIHHVGGSTRNIKMTFNKYKKIITKFI